MEKGSTTSDQAGQPAQADCPLPVLLGFSDCVPDGFAGTVAEDGRRSFRFEDHHDEPFRLVPGGLLGRVPCIELQRRRHLRLALVRVGGHAKSATTGAWSLTSQTPGKSRTPPVTSTSSRQSCLVARM